MPSGPERIGLGVALAGLRDGSCDAHQILDQCHDRIALREPEVHAWQWLRPRAEAHDWLRTHADLLATTPLRGLPVGIKDIIDTRDSPTEMGSALHRGRRPVDDAACVAHLRAMGALILGKTVTTELAFFAPGRTANPRDLTCTPGGSSSGSAAAVADGMVPMALGTQTAGSIIRPASFCGVAGYVSTRGLLSLRGVLPFAQSFDALGVFASEPMDLEIVADLFLSSAPVPRGDPRILVLSGDAFGPVSAEMAEAVRAMADRCADLDVEVVSFPVRGDAMSRLIALHRTVMAFEAARNLTAEVRRRADLSPQLATLLEQGRTIPVTEYAAAMQDIAEIDRQVQRVQGPGDLVLCAGAPGSAPEGFDSTGSPHMSQGWQALGRPALAVPTGVDSANRPLGVQFVAQRWQDARLLAFGRRIAAV